MSNFSDSNCRIRPISVLSVLLTNGGGTTSFFPQDTENSVSGCHASNFRARSSRIVIGFLGSFIGNMLMSNFSDSSCLIRPISVLSVLLINGGGVISFFSQDTENSFSGFHASNFRSRSSLTETFFGGITIGNVLMSNFRNSRLRIRPISALSVLLTNGGGVMPL